MQINNSAQSIHAPSGPSLEQLQKGKARSCDGTSIVMNVVLPIFALISCTCLITLGILASVISFPISSALASMPLTAGILGLAALAIKLLFRNACSSKEQRKNSTITIKEKKPTFAPAKKTETPKTPNDQDQKVKTKIPPPSSSTSTPILEEDGKMQENVDVQSTKQKDKIQKQAEPDFMITCKRLYARLKAHEDVSWMQHLKQNIYDSETLLQQYPDLKNDPSGQSLLQIIKTLKSFLELRDSITLSLENLVNLIEQNDSPETLRDALVDITASLKKIDDYQEIPQAIRKVLADQSPPYENALLFAEIVSGFLETNDESPNRFKEILDIAEGYKKDHPGYEGVFEALCRPLKQTKTEKSPLEPIQESESQGESPSSTEEPKEQMSRLILQLIPDRRKILLSGENSDSDDEPYEEATRVPSPKSNTRNVKNNNSKTADQNGAPSKSQRIQAKMARQLSLRAMLQNIHAKVS